MNNGDYGYDCESNYGRFGDEGARNFRVPIERESEEDESDGDGETEEVKKEILGKYEELMNIWAQIVEVGASLDPQMLNQLRQQLQALMYDLKIIDESGNCDLDKLIKLCGVLVNYKEKPVVKKGYPNREKFEEVYRKVKRNHVLISDLTGRDGKELGDYLYGLGIIMDNEIVYKTIFENDPIIFRDGKVENGRHREAAKAVLTKCGYALLHEWLKPMIEK